MCTPATSIHPLTYFVRLSNNPTFELPFAHLAGIRQFHARSITDTPNSHVNVSCMTHEHCIMLFIGESRGKVQLASSIYFISIRQSRTRFKNDIHLANQRPFKRPKLRLRARIQPCPLHNCKSRHDLTGDSLPRSLTRRASSPSDEQQSRSIVLV